MAITSMDIQNQSFKIERRGYDVDEVDVFLERVASEIDALNEEIINLRNELADAPRSSQSATVTPSAADAKLIAQKDARIEELEAKVRDRKSEDSAIAQALIVAQRTGDEIVAKSKADAEQTRLNAEEEAKRILDKAGSEKQRVIDSINELNASREEIRLQYQDMLKEFIGHATVRLTEIGGDVTTDFVLPADLVESVNAEAVVSQWTPTTTTSTYTTPTVSSSVAAPAVPRPSAPSKDLSGYGDADDSFSFDDVD